MNAPHIARIEAALLGVVQSGWYVLGSAVRGFEEAFAARTGARHAISFSSGTAALHAAAFSAGCAPTHALQLKGTHAWPPKPPLPMCGYRRYAATWLIPPLRCNRPLLW